MEIALKGFEETLNKPPPTQRINTHIDRRLWTPLHVVSGHFKAFGREAVPARWSDGNQS